MQILIKRIVRLPQSTSAKCSFAVFMKTSWQFVSPDHIKQSSLVYQPNEFVDMRNASQISAAAKHSARVNTLETRAKDSRVRREMCKVNMTVPEHRGSLTNINKYTVISICLMVMNCVLYICIWMFVYLQASCTTTWWASLWSEGLPGGAVCK